MAGPVVTGVAASSRRRWVPVTLLGRLVKEGKFQKVEEIYLHSLPVKEHQILEILVPGLKDDVMKVTPMQKQTRSRRCSSLLALRMFTSSRSSTKRLEGRPRVKLYNSIIEL